MAAQVSGVKGHVQMMGVCQGYWQADGRAMTAAWGGPAQRRLPLSLCAPTACWALPDDTVE